MPDLNINMNKFIICIGLLCWMASLASSEAKIGKPWEAEQNFKLLKEKMKTKQDSNFAKLIGEFACEIPVPKCSD